MKKHLILPFAGMLLSLFACTSSLTDDVVMVEKSAFTFNDAVLPHGEKIEIISSPGTIEYDQEKFDHYSCVQAVAQTTSDTFNVLIFPYNSPISPEDNMRYFIPSESVEYTVFLTSHSNLQGQFEVPKPDQVKIIKELGIDFYKRYPTVVGVLANDYTPGNKEQ
ncbi:MAG: hypothetical protein EP332_09640 [Bacteroidetes bacterium]|nr:MAG: hypothetical protein EP332_09640 [Bacteroidota bacterium]